MKIAILGSTPIALETALRFHLHGAALTWYEDAENFFNFTSQGLNPDAYISDVGLGVLKELNLSYEASEFSWANWKSHYAKPLTDYLKAYQEVKSDEVVSITKRFLAPGEVITGRSRFLDLFRLIYKVNPKDFIEEQRESNPETYERMTEEMLKSLANTIEMFQDYDLILDMRSDLFKASASASGRALGESRASDKVSYGLEALEFSKTLRPGPDFREIGLVGSDSLSAEILLSMEDWIREKHSRLFIVTTEEEPFNNFLAVADSKTRSKLEKLFQDIDHEFELEVDSFTKKLREWQELDDFVQVKIPRPAEPIPRLNYFSGHNVSAIDELIDRKRMFMTLEKPEFRDGKKHPENNHLDLKTIGVDHILVGHTKKNLEVLTLDHNEAGFFALIPTRPNVEGGWSKDLAQLEGIEDEIFKLFSPASSH